jgi:hypothetical protein
MPQIQLWRLPNCLAFRMNPSCFLNFKRFSILSYRRELNASYKALQYPRVCIISLVCKGYDYLVIVQPIGTMGSGRRKTKRPQTRRMLGSDYWESLRSRAFCNNNPFSGLFCIKWVINTIFTHVFYRNLFFRKGFKPWNLYGSVLMTCLAVWMAPNETPFIQA